MTLNIALYNHVKDHVQIIVEHINPNLTRLQNESYNVEMGHAFSFKHIVFGYFNQKLFLTSYKTSNSR